MFFTPISSARADNENATAYTYTISEDGQWVRTQDAYLVSTILFKDAGLKKPEDICIKGDNIYIADSGNSRIVILNKRTGIFSSFGENSLNSPTGIYVDDDNDIWVADYGLKEVLRFSPNGTLLKRYKRPTSIIFGIKANFNPKKVVVDKKKNIYIVSEGSYDGIIQLSEEGDFLGYFGANRISVTPLDVIRNIFFTEAQQAQLFHKIPQTFYNVAIDEKGLVYTITQSVKGDAIKKHSVSGKNILKNASKMVDEQNFVDLTIGNYNQIYAVTETGLIYEYDSEGNLIFSFGGMAISTERNGLFTVASGIAVDNNENVYVLDKERAIVHVFSPTAFASMTHKALNLFENGRYVESAQLWDQILKLNSRSQIANNGIGKAYFQTGDYYKASEYFKKANNKIDYSDAYWEIRNTWLQNNIGNILILCALLWLVWHIAKALDKRYRIFDFVRNVNKSIVDIKIINDIGYMFNFIKHPIDSFYYIRHDEKGSTVAATILYILGLLVFVLSYLFMGFMFSTHDPRDTSYIYVIMLFAVPIILWVFSNYLVSSINEGEGRLKDVYNATAYAMSPMIIFMPVVVALSYVLTLNEAFVIQFSNVIILTWCSIMLFIGTKEIHDYSVSGTIKNILLTLFLMFIVVIAFSILYMLGDEAVNFLYTFIKEALYRLE